MRLLLVEDEPRLGSRLKQELKQAGFADFTGTGFFGLDDVFALTTFFVTGFLIRLFRSGLSSFGLIIGSTDSLVVFLDEAPSPLSRNKLKRSTPSGKSCCLRITEPV